MLVSPLPSSLVSFTERLEFPQWSEGDCCAAIGAKAAAKGVDLGAEALAVLTSGLAVVRRQQGWANARDAHATYDLL